MPGNGNGSWFLIVCVLPVTSARPCQSPTITFNNSYRFSNFGQLISSLSNVAKPTDKVPTRWVAKATLS